MDGDELPDEETEWEDYDEEYWMTLDQFKTGPPQRAGQTGRHRSIFATCLKNLIHGAMR